MRGRYQQGRGLFRRPFGLAAEFGGLAVGDAMVAAGGREAFEFVRQQIAAVPRQRRVGIGQQSGRRQQRQRLAERAVQAGVAATLVGVGHALQIVEDEALRLHHLQRQAAPRTWRLSPPSASHAARASSARKRLPPRIAWRSGGVRGECVGRAAR